MDWKRIGPWQDVYSIVRANWLRITGSVEESEQPDPDPANYPDYYTRHDQPDNPKGHYTRRRRWF